MTNYPPMPPQGPYGYGAPPPQQPPHGYVGPPPQQPPYGYGGPPPAGYGGPPPPGYGYPPPGYGGPPPPGYGGPPPPKGPGKWLLIGGLAAAAVIALVVVIAVTSGSGSSSPATSADPDTSIGSGGDEAAIRQMIANMASSNSRDFASMVQKYFCTADQELLESIGGPSGIDLPDSSGDTTGDGEITDIKVTGDKATAKARVGGMTSTMYFRKEAGAWKFCMSDAPEIANLPDFPR